MAGRTPADAAHAFHAPIKQALGCFLDGRVSVDTYEAGKPGILTLNGGAKTTLFGDKSLAVDITIWYTIVNMPDDPIRGPWKVRTDGWFHTLHRGDDELLGYHWHPEATPDVLIPHVHFEGGKIHNPTGRVLVEDVLRVSIEYGAEPRDREKWDQIEAWNRERFAVGARWGIGPTPPPAED